MATISVETTDGHRDDTHFWEEVGQGDEGEAVRILGGSYTAFASGNFSGSAAVAFQYSPDNVTFVDVDSISLNFTANGVYNFEIADGFIKPVLSSGDGSADVDVTLKPIRG